VPKRCWIWVALALLGVSLAVVSILPRRGSVVGWVEPHPGRYDHSAGSTDLAADLKLMWETEPLRGTLDATYSPNPRASTDRAINAASRVFNTVELVGKSREEVVALLGDPQASSDNIYNFKFWPPPKGTLVYNFVSGAYGWLFNLVLGEDGRVREVQRQWVH
jgi:hypothetical protein